MGKKLPLLMLLAVLLLAGANAMWFEELGMNVGVSMASLDLSITSYKLLCQYCDCDEGDCEMVVNDDGKEASVITYNVPPGSALWVGLVISNDGTVPAVLTDVVVEGEATGTEVYVYGPFRSPGNSGVWGNVELSELPFSGDTGLPGNDCDPSFKYVVWIKIVVPSASNSKFAYAISIIGGMSS